MTQINMSDSILDMQHHFDKVAVASAMCTQAYAKPKPAGGAKQPLICCQQKSAPMKSALTAMLEAVAQTVQTELQLLSVACCKQSKLNSSSTGIYG